MPAATPLPVESAPCLLGPGSSPALLCSSFQTCCHLPSITQFTRTHNLVLGTADLPAGPAMRLVKRRSSGGEPVLWHSPCPASSTVQKSKVQKSEAETTTGKPAMDWGRAIAKPWPSARSSSRFSWISLRTKILILPPNTKPWGMKDRTGIISKFSSRSSSVDPN